MKTITPAQLEMKLSRIGDQMDNALESGMKEVVLQVENKSKGECPVRTGHLRRSIDSKVETQNEVVTGTISANTNYAAAVHEGTSKQQANPFILRAIKQSGDLIKRELSTAVKVKLQTV